MDCFASIYPCATDGCNNQLSDVNGNQKQFCVPCITERRKEQNRQAHRRRSQ